MNETYQDPSHPASFGGVDALHRALGRKVSRKEIKNFLEGVDAYTLHKSIRKKFPTNKVIVYSIDQQWQADLVDLSSLSKYNKGYRYLLCCIDVLSKYAWIVPLKQKRGTDILEAFKIIFSHRKPKFLQTDQGTEFENSIFQKFLKENNVKYFTTYNATKASIVERFNRTLKTKMWKYFTSQNTYTYLNVLQKLVQSYNNTYHSSIKRRPIEVNSENEREVWFTLYGKKSPPSTCVLNVGDIVRISKKKLIFEKGYETNFSEELFVVSECVKRSPSVYRIKDLLGEPVLGTFYLQELQKVKLKESFPFEKILKKRTKKKRLEYFVKFKGYPNKFNQWIPASNISAI
ncbi:Putative uncharacterized transposon-derived protein F54H12.3 [Araneus ventricosus]|uniref:Uncharacterized transposon-derived protein F54H12.3 n=1 Tax=Araneus ventricosus TaxID=182803 RepID=A0A4Y2VKW2_ARAVE|nr:Putative uncharacterized transposon-derived protein F54H12.3 [Araneus ventricosus]